jgi:hypothetical protein
MNTLCSQELLERSLAGSLGADDEVALSQHLDECEMCSAELERLAGGESKCREIATLLRPDDLDDAVARREECSMADFVVEHLEPADDPSVLGRIGPYDVLEIIGRGGMGIVLKGFDRELKRFVAIKALAPHLAHSALARKRFSREAQSAAAVVDLHVIAIHHVQSSGPLPFLVMPLLNGESLSARIKARGSLELTEVLRIGMQAALGLAAAHAQGLVHRDVKPANILLEKGVERAVLTDFGLARAGDDVSMTRWGIIAGTPEYMSPEQARGAALDARSDLFSLGCVLYEMATGVSPFRAESTMATLRRIVDDKPTALASLAPNLPPWFIAIVERLLSKEPAERFATASEVSELLEQCLSHLQQPTTWPLPMAVKTRTSRYRGRPPLPRWLAAGAASFILLLAGVIVVLELNKGELTIECSAKEVPVRILQGDAVVKKMTVTTAGTTVRVAAGKYVVEIDGGQDDLIVQGGSVSLNRGGVEIVRITHKEDQPRANQETEQLRKANPNAVTVPNADPREKLSTLIPEAIRILEAKEYSIFLKNFVSPTEFRELILKTGLDQSAFARQFGDKRAPQLLLILKSLSDAKLTLDPIGMIVTYELPESVGRRNTLSFQKIVKYWYMLNKVDEPTIPRHTVVLKGALETPASSRESKRSRDASVANIKLREFKAIDAAHRLIEELSQMRMAGIVQIVADEKTNSVEASGDATALKFVREYLDRIESDAARSKDSGERPSESDQPARAASDQVEEPANGLPTPEAAADALIRAYATRDYELFLKTRLRTVCETNDKDGPAKYADALHFSQLMRGKDRLTVYDLKRRLKPDSIRALAANSSRELTRAIETALQFYGEEYRYVDVTSDGFDGSQYVIRVIVARNGNQWYAIPHGYSSENAYKAVDAFAQAKEEAPAR